MAKRAAAESRLAELHSVFCEMLFDEIAWYKSQDIPMAAADKTVIVTFLKNNSITCEIDDQKLTDLREAFKDDHAKVLAERASKITSNPDRDGAFAGRLQ